MTVLRLLRPLPRVLGQFALPPLLAQAVLRGTPGGDVAVAATAVLLAAYVAFVSLTGRWTPRATLLVPLACLAAVPAGLARLPGAAPTVADLAVAALAGSLAVFFTLRAARALRGRADLPGLAIDLSVPLAAGRYVVVQGGSQHILNAHLACLAMPDFRGQSYAVDIVADGEAILGRDVLAPLDARVAHVVDGLPDLEPPDTDRERPMGNHVWLEAAGPTGPVAILLAHLRRGTVLVDRGATVSRGARIGAVGNSGNTSEPHLHIHAQTLGKPPFTLAADPLPICFAGHGQLHRGQRIRAPERPDARPTSGIRTSPASCLRSRS